MPELPDLEVIRHVLAGRVVGVPIVSVEILRPLIVRNLLATETGEELAPHLIGRSFSGVQRRGKFLLLFLDSDAVLVIHPMLAGRLCYGRPLARHRSRDALVLGLADGQELRYHDARDMGKVYVVHDPEEVPTFASLGPEANDAALTLEVFRERLRARRGEIKGVLVDQTFVAGIGNAYADEILWRARLYPFRRRSSLAPDDVAALHHAMQTVLDEAIQTLSARLGDQIDVEVRDFLSVHGKGGSLCPRCGSAISEVKRQGSATHFCRTCQPGVMVAR